MVALDEAGISMTDRVNQFGQPIGFAIPDWQARPLPPSDPMDGRFVRIERLDPARHADQLFAANATDAQGRMWTYMPYGPFADIAAYRQWAADVAPRTDPFFHTIIDQASGQAQGVASYLRIDAAMGVIEVGHIAYAPVLQKTAGATEAMYLLMRRVFDELGYRRYEWKCDALNAPSRLAALRLGFSYEGIFRQATIYKGRNRDTAWFAITDRDWPKIRAIYETWLAPTNIDSQGQARQRLSSLMAVR
jgi:RimJ/RimL family protein N-acetyltransferase